MMKDQTYGPRQTGGYRRTLASALYARLGQLQDRIGSLTAAEAFYRKALSRRPGQFDALAGLGRLLLRERRYEEAVPIWREVVALRPSSASMTFQLSRALHRSGQLDQAAASYLRVVVLDPAHEKAAAAIIDLAKRFAGALPPAANSPGLQKAAWLGRELLELHSDKGKLSAGVATIAGAICAAAGQLAPREPAAALEHFDAALTLAPDLLEAQRGAVLCCERLGDLERAVAILQRQLDANPHAVEARLTIDRLRALLAKVPNADRSEALVKKARGLVERSAGGASVDPQEILAVLAKARGLIEADVDGPAADGIIDPEEREALLARARQLIDLDSVGPDDREALLARARQLIDLDSVGPDDREALLARARRLIDLDSVGPDDREALLARARQLVEPESGRAVADAAVDPDERAALVMRARRLRELSGIASNGPLRNVSEAELRVALARAEQRLTGRESLAPAGPADGLTPRERDAVIAATWRVRETEGVAVPVNAEQREALLARARAMARASASAGESSATGDDAETREEGRAAVDVDGSPAGPDADGPISMPRLFQLAQAAHNEGRFDDAELFYREVIARNAAHVQALTRLSRLLMRQQRWKDAADVLGRLDAAQPDAVEPKRLLASALLREDRFEAAARVYTALSLIDPDDPTTWKSLGQVQKRLGNWAAARTAWKRLCQLSPGNHDARFELAQACQQVGDESGAETELHAILMVEPDHKAALTLLGRMSLASQPDASLSWWTRLAVLDPDAVEPTLQIARIHLRQERLPEAEAAFRKVLERQAGHAEASASLGKLLFDRDSEEAVQILRGWAGHDTAAVAPWLAMGRLHAGARQVDLAEAAYRRALEIEPSNLEALTRLGRLLGDDQRHDDALQIWSRIVEVAPDRMEAKLQVARILYTRHDPCAEDALRAVLAIDPANRQALRLLAQHLSRSRSTIDAALEIWQQLSDLDSESVVPIAQRGRLLERIGRSTEAEAEYRRAIARDPRHPMALGDLARFYRVQRRWGEAAEIYRAHLRLDAQRLDVILGLGQCLDRTNQLTEAKELYDRALGLDPDNITALGYRGRLLRARGQVNDAITDFRRICELEPRNAEAWHELIFQLAGAERESEALEALAKAESALGETPEAWAILGRAAAASLFDKQAVAYFRRAIEAERDNAAHHAQLGLYYFRQGILDGAFHHLLDSRDLDPRNVEVARCLFDTTCALRELGHDHVAMRRGPRTVGDILVPDRLFAHVKQLSEIKVRPYEPVPRSVVAISATLAPGGAERQLVNMLRGLSAPEFDLRLALFCISLTPRLRRDFFLPVLDGTGVDVVLPDPAAASDYLHDPDVGPFAEVIRHFPKDMVGPMAFWLGEFRRRRPQVVHAWQDSTNLTAVVAALLAGVPRVVLCCRSVRPDNPRRRLRRFMQAAYQAVLEHPSIVLSNNSRAGADDYAAWLGIDPARVEVVYNGIDFDRLDKAADSRETSRAREQLGIPPTAPVLGGVFRMSEEKRPLLWLDVAAAVARSNRDVQFVVCGDGPMRDEMRDHASTLGIADRLHMPGAQSNIGSWYKMMDVVMLTSRHEGLPNVLLEAQSLGIPVVAPNVGGMSEVVEQGITGWTICNADAESLAERVLFCLSDSDWRAAATRRAPHFVRELFSVETMLRRNLEVYEIPLQVAADA